MDNRSDLPGIMAHFILQARESATPGAWRVGLGSSCATPCPKPSNTLLVCQCGEYPYGTCRPL